jgi:hypothetical protein
MMASPRGTVTIPWCENCQRSRFGRECVECGKPLVLETFAPLARAQRAEQLAWDIAKAARCYEGGDVDLDAALARFDAAAAEALG